jgi:hypothetical protein
VLRQCFCLFSRAASRGFRGSRNYPICFFMGSCLKHRAASFFSNYTIHRRHSQRMHTHPYEYTHANPTPRSIFEDCAGKSSRLTKSPQTPRCRRERRLPLKEQTPLNPEKFAHTGSRTQDLRCYRSSCNH